MAQPGVPCLLLACGSFNPPTILHLRMFEIARDYLNVNTDFEVIGGVISPVHDSYGKKDLTASRHRVEMAKLATASSEWIGVDRWECTRPSWSRTVLVLRHLAQVLKAYLHQREETSFKDYLSAYDPESTHHKSADEAQTRVMLLCGADVLQSFSVKGLWLDEDMAEILSSFGMVVITRSGSDPFRFIYENDLVYQHQKNVHLVTEWIPNEISSTAIRRAIRRKVSVRYLIPDAVLEYIKTNELYVGS